MYNIISNFYIHTNHFNIIEEWKTEIGKSTIASVLLGTTLARQETKKHLQHFWKQVIF